MKVFLRKHLEIIADIVELFSFEPPAPKEPVNKRQFVRIE